MFAGPWVAVVGTFGGDGVLDTRWGLLGAGNDGFVSRGASAATCFSSSVCTRGELMEKVGTSSTGSAGFAFGVLAESDSSSLAEDPSGSTGSAAFSDGCLGLTACDVVGTSHCGKIFQDIGRPRRSKTKTMATKTRTVQFFISDKDVRLAVQASFKRRVLAVE